MGSRRAAVLVALLLASLAVGAAAEAEVVQKRGVRTSLDARLSPRVLPRARAAPIAVSFAGHISSASSSGPPQLRSISLALNSHGKLRTAGLPRCRLGRIQPSTDRAALAACRSSLVGEGSFSADVKLPTQSPFPSVGKVLAFNGRYHGAPAILVHIYGPRPVPTSYVLPFVIGAGHGTFGTVLEAQLPRVTGDWGYVTGISMKLKRTFVSHGRRRSYLTASCPAPKGFSLASFPLSRVDFSFAGDVNLSAVLERTCKVAG
jgi:hypothetical protein